MLNKNRNNKRFLSDRFSLRRSYLFALPLSWKNHHDFWPNMLVFFFNLSTAIVKSACNLMQMRYWSVADVHWAAKGESHYQLQTPSIIVSLITALKRSLLALTYIASMAGIQASKRKRFILKGRFEATIDYLNKKSQALVRTIGLMKLINLIWSN